MTYAVGTHIDLRYLNDKPAADPEPDTRRVAFLPGTKIFFLSLPPKLLGVAFLPDKTYCAL